MEFPVFTGYLKAVDTHLVGARVYMTMAVPNMEVRYIYENTIMEWFRRRVMKLDLTPLHQALLNGKSQNSGRTYQRLFESKYQLL